MAGCTIFGTNSKGDLGKASWEVDFWTPVMTRQGFITKRLEFVQQQPSCQLGKTPH